MLGGTEYVSRNRRIQGIRESGMDAPRSVQSGVGNALPETCPPVKDLSCETVKDKGKHGDGLRGDNPKAQRSL